MAHIDDLIAAVEDPALAAELRAEVKTLKDRKEFGLVFEKHHPETVHLARQTGVRAGDQVRLRRAPEDRTTYTVKSANGTAILISDRDGAEREEPLDDLLIVRGFADAIYPGLTSVGRIERSTTRPFHSVINAENFHALQVLVHCWEGEVDCIYIDPPYNTGARDWKYNNDYVDNTDRFRHSKWLSFMEKRLRIAKRLLKPDGVLIITIDENEVHHLGVLLEELAPDARIQMVTITINPSGASGAAGLSRVEEYAFFCFFGNAEPVGTDDDMLTDIESGGEADLHGVRWERLMRGGNAWYRDRRRNLCYPVLLNEDKTRMIRAGTPLEGDDEAARPTEIDGHPVAWPERTDGRLGIWRVDAAKLNRLIAKGYAQITSPPNKERPTLRYLLAGTVDAIEGGVLEVVSYGERGQVLVRDPEAGAAKRAKTVWHRGRHTAGGAGGTYVVNATLGERDLFSYPKSVYAVQDCLNVAIGDRKDALIVDFFAGSGTTLHAACLMNAVDDGRRRVVLVTNNEVDDKLARRLNEDGAFYGDDDFERHGIFEAVTKPRVRATILGRRPDGTLVEGEHLDGRPFSEGFEENGEFFRLDYLDRDTVELGAAFGAIHPLLWLSAGAGAVRDDTVDPESSFHVASGGSYAVLFDETRLPDLLTELRETAQHVHTVFLVTDSEDAYAEMTAILGPAFRTRMLYRDYLRSFRITGTAP